MVDVPAEGGQRNAVFTAEKRILLIGHVGLDKTEHNPVYEIELETGKVRTQQESKGKDKGYSKQ